MTTFQLLGIAGYAAATLASGPGASTVVAGRVTDASTGAAVAGAEIRLIAAGRETRSDDEGRFSIDGNDDVSRIDTLTVTHPLYHSARFLLGDEPEESANLRVGLRRRSAANAEILDTSTRADVQEMLRLTGGTLWAREQFWPHIRFVSRPLELLLFSGLVSSVSTESSEGPCVELPGGGDCAMVWVEGEAIGSRDLRDHFAAEVEAFVIVRPGRAVPDLGVTDSNPDGIVIVFFEEPSR